MASPIYDWEKEESAPPLDMFSQMEIGAEIIYRNIGRNATRPWILAKLSIGRVDFELLRFNNPEVQGSIGRRVVGAFAYTAAIAGATCLAAKSNIDPSLIYNEIRHSLNGR